MESMYRHHVEVALDAIAKLNHAERILAALREPSCDMGREVWETCKGYPLSNDQPRNIVRAGVAAAEQEVGACGTA